MVAEAASEMCIRDRVVGIVLIIVVVIGGLVGLSLVLNKDDKNVASGQATSTPPTSTVLVAGCVAPPKVPTDKRARTLPDKRTAAGKTFIATVTTNCGDITVELDGTKACLLYTSPSP